MRNPLATTHKLVVNALSKGVAHAAMIAGEPHAAADGGGQVLDLLLLDLRHSHDRHDEAHVDDARVGEGFGCVLDVDLEVLAFENLGKDMGALFRLMSTPSAPDNQRFTHFIPPHAPPPLRERGGREASRLIPKIWRRLPNWASAAFCSSIQFAGLKPCWHRRSALGARCNSDRGAQARGRLKRLHDLEHVEGDRKSVV